MDTQQTSKNTRVSVLDASRNEQKEIPLRHRHNIKTSTAVILVLLVMLMSAIINELSVYLLEIPSFNELEIYKGTIEIDAGRRNAFLSLKTDKDIIRFSCWIWVSGSSNCLTKEQYPDLIGEQGVIHSYRALISGVFHENRLLQLDVEGKTIIVYQEQKEKYLQKKESFSYFSTALFLTALFCVLFVYWIKRANISKKENE